MSTDPYITPEQFCTWLKGFVAASNHYNLTPDAWQQLKDALGRVRVEGGDKAHNYMHTRNETTTLNRTKELLND